MKTPMQELHHWVNTELTLDGYEHRVILDKIESMLQKEKPQSNINAAICCGVLEKMELGWMKLQDGTKCMPYIEGHSDENMYRVNNCPSCGKYVRDVMVDPCL